MGKRTSLQMLCQKSNRNPEPWVVRVSNRQSRALGDVWSADIVERQLNETYNLRTSRSSPVMIMS